MKKRHQSVDFERHGTTVILGSRRRLHRWFRMHYLVFSIFAAIVVTAVYGFLARAQISDFYPKSCLGDWEGVQNALGAPEVPRGSAPEEFTASNSAVFMKTSAQIFCGNFTGDIPPGNVVTKATLSLSWVLKTELPPPQEEIAVSSSISEMPSSSMASSTETWTTTSTAPSATIQSDGTASSSADFAITSSSQDVPGDAIPLATSETSSGAFASTTPSSSVILATSTVIEDEAASAPTGSQPELLQVPFALVAATGSQIASLPVGDKTDMVEISYSLTNGEDWTVLTRFEPDRWGEQEFDIPIGIWDDIADLQVRISAYSGVERSLLLYLDGMKLSVESEADSDPDTSALPSSAIQQKAQKPLFDQEAQHRCEVVPFGVALQPGSEADARIAFNPSDRDRSYFGKIGELPVGVTGSLETVASSTYELAMKLKAAANAQRGSFGAVIIYEENQEDGSVKATYCSFNISIL